MDRPTIIATVAAVITVAVGAFALSRAIATDGPVSTPAPVTTVAPVASGSAPPPASAPPAASGATEAPAGSSATAPVAIEISNFNFEPGDVTVAVGTEVVWTNMDDTEHSVVSDDGSFVSPTLEQGDTYSFTFTTPGEYDYICGFHTSMTGTITVTA